MSKGDRDRTADRQAYRAGWERTFGGVERPERRWCFGTHGVNERGHMTIYFCTLPVLHRGLCEDEKGRRFRGVWCRVTRAPHRIPSTADREQERKG